MLIVFRWSTLSRSYTKMILCSCPCEYLIHSIMIVLTAIESAHVQVKELFSIFKEAQLSLRSEVILTCVKQKRIGQARLVDIMWFIFDNMLFLGTC